MSNIKKHRFNLVEITLAVAVIAIGMSSILVLFPVGVNSHKEAIANNNLADISEYILGILEAKVMEEWAQCTYSGYNPDNPGSFNGTVTRGTSKFVENLPTSKASDTADLTLGKSLKGHDKNTDAWNKSRLFLAQKNSSDQSGVFLYEQATIIDGERAPDFSAVVCMWKSPVSLYLSNDTPKTISDYNYAVSLNLEISWPAEAPYDNREKRSYKLDLYNPYYKPVTP